MFDKIVALYCITDDLLKTIDHHDDQRRALSDAEVMTTPTLMKLSGLMPKMLSKSRLCRRLNQVEELTVNLFHQLGCAFKRASSSTQYLLDSFPLELCDNIRAPPRVITTSIEKSPLRCGERLFTRAKI